MTRRSIRRLSAVCLVGTVAACGGGPRPAAVSPQEIPALEARVRAAPGDATARFRLAGAYLAAERCDDAAPAARGGLQLDPDNVLGPLILGACHERAERYDLAVVAYDEFLAQFPRAPSVAAVHARKQTAVRRGAELAARQALAHEGELTALPAEPATLAVLPVVLSGDTAYQPLSRGLAELITTDLATIRSLRLLERLHVGALLDELELAAGGQTDPGTAARVGRLLRAERMVQGVAHIPSAHETIRLQASVVAGDGTVRPGDAVTGQFRELLGLQKQLVLGLAVQLGIQLTAAERQRILEQGPKNLAAFLAYSAGLDALDRGDYGAAARHFRDAVRSDPSFQAAEDARQAAEAAPVVEQVGTGGGIVTVTEAVQRNAPAEEPAAARAARGAAADIAPTLTDAIRQQTSTGSDATKREPTLETRGITNLQGTSAIIRIIFRRPL